MDRLNDPCQCRSLPSVTRGLVENVGTSIMWFRRDLRLGDNPALCEAAKADDVLPVFVFDKKLLAASEPRTARLKASLAALQADLDGALVVRTGDPATTIAALAKEVDAEEVHISTEITPYGRARDRRAAESLAGVGAELVETGSPYAVTPGRIVNGQGDHFKVFTPYSKAWRSHGWRDPAELPDVTWRTNIRGETLRRKSDSDVGERAALKAWKKYLKDDVTGYSKLRDRPDLDKTSRMSVPLKWGEIHPRTMLADLRDLRASGTRAGLDRYETEIAWREFYADVLWHRPDSAWADLRPEMSAMRYDDDADLIEAWREGRTGYPYIDAGLRQLLSEGWMHNRLRMATASFLVKDLHIWWPVGARHFLDHLLDGDIASNNHGWQWSAGTGTDAAPYFRIFNPVTQGLRFDPDGEYVRRWVKELRHLPGAAAHEPWNHDDGYEHGYPERVVDHAEERRESLDRLAAANSAQTKEQG